MHYETEDAKIFTAYMITAAFNNHTTNYYPFHISHSTITVAWSKMFHFKINLACCEKWLVSNSETLYGWQHNNYHN